MSAKLYQYHEEKAKRLSLRTDTDPDVVWLRNYVRNHIHEYIRQRDEKLLADLMDDAFSS
jgi:hypothetical protein